MAKRVIISGGGTGGHIFPAIAIAHALKRIAPETRILFVGAEGKMEMEKVPAAGYEIIGLEIQGFNRKSLWRNWNLPFKLMRSMRKARGILKSFKPDVAVGVGGYASGPLLLAAGRMGIPYLIQEQNSYAGITNKRLGVKAEKICVAFEGMSRFFPADKLILTGNPIRPEAIAIEGKQEEALAFFGFNAEQPTILVTGGSLGAKTLNDAIESGLEKLRRAGVQIIWQCGNYYHQELSSRITDRTSLYLVPFLQRMDYAYAAADIIISRAGAGTISELYAVAKPVILIPSPNVAEDHQTKNAQALVEKDAAVLLSDEMARLDLVDSILDLLEDSDRRIKMSEQLRGLALTSADEEIAREVLRIASAGQTSNNR